MPEVNGILRDFSQIDFVRIGVIIASAWLALRLVRWFFPWLADRAPGRFRLYLLPAAPLLQLVIVAGSFAAVMALVVELTPEKALVMIGVLSISLGFAFREYASSLVAGIVAVFERPYRVGDWIQVDDAYGEVISVGFRAVVLRSPDDSVILIPHKKLWDCTIINDNRGNREHQCVADFYLHPEHDAQEVRQKLREVAITSPYLHTGRPIAVIVQEKPWGTHYRLKAYPIDGREQFNFISDLTVRGKEALAELAVIPVISRVALPDQGR